MDIVRISYREELLRTFYIIDKITRRIGRISFGLYNLKISLLKQAKYDNNIIADIITIIEQVKDSICNLHEMIRAVSINHKNIIELTHEIQILENRSCSNDRNILVKAFHLIENTNKLILFKHTFEAIEEKKREADIKKLMIHSQDLL